jgi:hypothetical protein
VNEFKPRNIFMGGRAPFKAKGGKMIHYHGQGDALVSVS